MICQSRFLADKLKMKQGSQHVSGQASLCLFCSSTMTVEPLTVDDGGDRDGVTPAAVDLRAVLSSVFVLHVAGGGSVVLNVWTEVAEYSSRVPPSTLS